MPYYNAVYLLIFLTAVILFCAAYIISIKNSVAQDYGRVLGFRKTLIITEESRLKMLLKDNPSYFYDVLPYAYVFGITG